jgi:hypothetical protein
LVTPPARIAGSALARVRVHQIRAHRSIHTGLRRTIVDIDSAVGPSVARLAVAREPEGSIYTFPVVSTWSTSACRHFKLTVLAVVARWASAGVVLATQRRANCIVLTWFAATRIHGYGAVRTRPRWRALACDTGQAVHTGGAVLARPAEYEAVVRVHFTDRPRIALRALAREQICAIDTRGTMEAWGGHTLVLVDLAIRALQELLQH